MTQRPAWPSTVPGTEELTASHPPCSPGNTRPMHACVHTKSLQACLSLCGPMDCSPPGSSVDGILQARILEWVAMPSLNGPSRPRDQILTSCVSCIGTVAHKAVSPLSLERCKQTLDGHVTSCGWNPCIGRVRADSSESHLRMPLGGTLCSRLSCCKAKVPNTHAFWEGLQGGNPQCWAAAQGSETLSAGQACY